jgi:hypothetical protein
MNTQDEQAKFAELNENKGRRRFVRTVGIAVPVALTVSARSTMAATCNVVSAHASINLTNSHNSTSDVGIPNNAQTPADLAKQNAAYFTGANGNFLNIFGFGGPNLPMRQVLIQQVPSATFASYIAAAYVNLRKEPAIGVCYTLQNLKDMWQFGPFGTFHPLASNTMVNWDQQKIIDYLIDTWTI